MSLQSILLGIEFAPTTSPYQRLKIEFLSIVHLSKDAVHIYIGVACLLATLLLLRGRVKWKALLPGLAVSLAMEAVDLSDEWHVGHRLAWRASVHDIVNTNAIPFVLVAFLHLFVVSRGGHSSSAQPPHGLRPPPPPLAPRVNRSARSG